MAANQPVLGKKVVYVAQHSPHLLWAIPRKAKRDEIGVQNPLPFYGYDLWNAYEVSWLNSSNKPEVKIAEICYNANSPFIVESKSLKLYLISFFNSNFGSASVVRETVAKDLFNILQTDVQVKLVNLDTQQLQIRSPSGICIDYLDVACKITGNVEPKFLECTGEYDEESVYSNLLKSNCLMTGQPDLGTIEISYKGLHIRHDSLLKYIVSFRNHNEFHEQCVERIFMDIMNYCRPQRLTVYARYTRRGGIDINPFRSTEKSHELNNARLIRQ
ncbi:NADPH-dependent 7-cyano-7-deazaguanine reductase [Alphaproteobacteria bacterium]